MASATQTLPEKRNGDSPTQTVTLAKRPPMPSEPLAKLKWYLQDPDVQGRLSDMLGKRASAFTNSLINLAAGDPNVKKCTPDSIMKSAMIAASIDMPVDKALGFAAIVPYGSEAQFQLMVKGLIQLAIRSGQYKHINNTEVYKDELLSHNPITGETIFTDQSTWKMRYEGKVEDIAGYYSCFELHSGFRCSNFIATAEAMAHGKKFSKAYQYDLKQGKSTSLWSTNPVAMGKKTSLKMLLGKFGILSTEMQQVFVAESDDFTEGAKPVESHELRPTSGRQKFGFEAPALTGDVQGEDPAMAPVEGTVVDAEPTMFDQQTPAFACPQCGATFPVKPAKGRCPDCDVEVNALA